MDVYTVEATCSFFLSGIEAISPGPSLICADVQMHGHAMTESCDCSLFDHYKSISGNIILNDDD